MKNLLFYSGILLVTLVFSCVKQELPVDEEVSTQGINYSSVNEIVALDLDVKFNIPKTIYKDFLDNVIFMDGQLRGLKYTEIDLLLSDSQSNEFWANFGFSVRANASTQGELRLILARPAYFGKKPVSGGCAPQLEFVCFGNNGGSDIDGYKPITGGCEQEAGHVCFNP